MLFSLCFAADAPAQQTTDARPAADAGLDAEARRALEAAARQRATGLGELFASIDPTAVRAFVAENFAPGFIETVPMERHVGVLTQLQDWTRGMDVLGVEVLEPGEVEVVMRNRLTGWRETLLLMLEPEPPHRIAGLMPRAMAPPAAGERRSSEAIASALEDLLDRLAAADVFSGAVLLARAGPGGDVVFSGAWGEANKDFGAPNRTDTKFNLGSMNKMFTAVAIARLVDQGKLSYDDSLSDFLPDFPNADAAGRIRIEHLLTHTSGLGSYFGEEFMNASRARFRTVDDFLELARDESLAFEPGTRWRYSNTGFMVLGKVIEVVSGQSYDEFVREQIYEPAGMTGTGQYALDLVNPNLAIGYEKEYSDDGVVFRNNLFEHVIQGGPAGGGYSTVADLHRFAEALRSGVLVSPATFALMTSPKPELASPRYGYGFGVGPGEIVGHSGGFPGISSNLDIFTESGYTAVVLSNYGSASFRVVQAIRALLEAE